MTGDELRALIEYAVERLRSIEPDISDTEIIRIVSDVLAGHWSTETCTWFDNLEQQAHGQVAGD